MTTFVKLTCVLDTGILSSAEFDIITFELFDFVGFTSCCCSGCSSVASDSCKLVDELIATRNCRTGFGCVICLLGDDDLMPSIVTYFLK